MVNDSELFESIALVAENPLSKEAFARLIDKITVGCLVN